MTRRSPSTPLLNKAAEMPRRKNWATRYAILILLVLCFLSGWIFSGDKITGINYLHNESKPRIAFVEPPSMTEKNAVRLVYEATSENGILSVKARIVPQAGGSTINASPVEIELTSPGTQNLRNISFEDLTSHSFAGQSVKIQLVVSDAAGHEAQSEAINFFVPDRVFSNPLARALIEERKKLAQNPDDKMIREEAANIMAGIAREPAIYHGDAVVLMALRVGAVRLVLDKSHNSTASVNELLWKAAVRIEKVAAALAMREP